MSVLPAPVSPAPGCSCDRLRICSWAAWVMAEAFFRASWMTLLVSTGWCRIIFLVAARICANRRLFSFIVASFLEYR
jgi:hypothetical protein